MKTDQKETIRMRPSDDEIETMFARTPPTVFKRDASHEAFEKRLMMGFKVSAVIPAEARGALLVRLPGKEGESVEKREIASELVVGRNGKSAWFVKGDNTLSARHFAIRKSEGEYVIQDLDSKNGTFLNEDTARMTKESPLKHGDFIRAGKSTFMVAIAEGS